jgi:hypothetical protein
LATVTPICPMIIGAFGRQLTILACTIKDVGAGCVNRPALREDTDDLDNATNGYG